MGKSKNKKWITIFGGIIILFLSFLVSSQNERKVDAAPANVLVGSNTNITQIDGSGGATYCTITAKYNGLILTVGGTKESSTLKANLTVTQGATCLSATTTISDGTTTSENVSSFFSSYDKTYTITVKATSTTYYVSTYTYHVKLVSDAVPYVFVGSKKYNSDANVYVNSSTQVTFPANLTIQTCAGEGHYDFSCAGTTTGGGYTSNMYTSSKTVTYFSSSTVGSQRIIVSNVSKGTSITVTVYFYKQSPRLMCRSGVALTNYGTYDYCALYATSATAEYLGFTNWISKEQVDGVEGSKIIRNGTHSYYVKDIFGNSSTVSSFTVEDENPSAYFSSSAVYYQKASTYYFAGNPTIYFSDNENLTYAKVISYGADGSTITDNTKYAEGSFTISEQVSKVTVMLRDAYSNNAAYYFYRDEVAPVLVMGETSYEFHLYEAQTNKFYTNSNEFLDGLYKHHGHILNFSPIEFSDPGTNPSGIAMSLHVTITDSTGSTHNVEDWWKFAYYNEPEYFKFVVRDFVGNTDAFYLYIEYDIPKVYTYNEFGTEDINKMYFEDGGVYYLGKLPSYNIKVSSQYGTIYNDKNFHGKTLYTALDPIAAASSSATYFTYSTTVYNGLDYKVKISTYGGIVIEFTIYFIGWNSRNSSMLESAFFDDSYNSRSARVGIDVSDSDYMSNIEHVKVLFVYKRVSIEYAASINTNYYLKTTSYYGFSDTLGSLIKGQTNTLVIAGGLPELSYFTHLGTIQERLSSGTEETYYESGGYTNTTLNKLPALTVKLYEVNNGIDAVVDEINMAYIDNEFYIARCDLAGCDQRETTQFETFGGNNLYFNFSFESGNISSLYIMDENEDYMDAFKSINADVKSVSTNKYSSGRYSAVAVDSNGFSYEIVFYLDKEGPHFVTSFDKTYYSSENGHVVIIDRYNDGLWSFDIIDESGVNSDIRYHETVANEYGFHVVNIAASSTTKAHRIIQFGDGDNGVKPPKNEVFMFKLMDVYDFYGNGFSEVVFHVFLGIGTSTIDSISKTSAYDYLFDMTVNGHFIEDIGVETNSYRGITGDLILVPYNSGYDVAFNFNGYSTQLNANYYRKIYVTYTNYYGTKISNELTTTNGIYSWSLGSGFDGVKDGRVLFTYVACDGYEFEYDLLFVNVNSRVVKANYGTVNGKVLSSGTNYFNNHSVTFVVDRNSGAYDFVLYDYNDSVMTSWTDMSKSISFTRDGQYILQVKDAFGINTDSYDIVVDTSTPILYDESGNNQISDAELFVNNGFNFTIKESLSISYYVDVYNLGPSFASYKTNGENYISVDSQVYSANKLFNIKELINGVPLDYSYSLNLTISDSASNSRNYVFFIYNGELNCIVIYSVGSYFLTGYGTAGFEDKKGNITNSDISNFVANSSSFTNVSVSSIGALPDSGAQPLTFMIDSANFELDEDYELSEEGLYNIHLEDVFGNCLTVELRIQTTILEDDIYVDIGEDRYYPALDGSSAYFAKKGSTVSFGSESDSSVIFTSVWKVHYVSDKFTPVSDPGSFNTNADGVWKIKATVGNSEIVFFIIVGSDQLFFNVYAKLSDSYILVNAGKTYYANGSSVDVTTYFVGDYALPSSVIQIGDGCSASCTITNANSSIVELFPKVYIHSGYEEYLEPIRIVFTSGDDGPSVVDSVNPVIEYVSGAFDKEQFDLNSSSSGWWYASNGSPVRFRAYDAGFINLIKVNSVSVSGTSKITETNISNEIIEDVESYIDLSNEGLYSIYVSDLNGNATTVYVSVVKFSNPVSYGQVEAYSNYTKVLQVAVDNNDNRISLENTSVVQTLSVSEVYDLTNIKFESKNVRGIVSFSNYSFPVDFSVPEKVYDLSSIDDSGDFVKSVIEYNTQQTYDDILLNGLNSTSATGLSLFTVSNSNVSLLSNISSVTSSMVTLNVDALLQTDGTLSYANNINNAVFVSNSNYQYEDTIADEIVKHGIINNSGSNSLSNPIFGCNNAYFGIWVDGVYIPIRIDISSVVSASDEAVADNNGLILLNAWKEDLFYEEKKQLI